MITRPLDLASKLRPEPRNFDWLFFVNAGLLSLRQSIPVIMGANIGTTASRAALLAEKRDALVRAWLSESRRGATIRCC